MDFGDIWLPWGQLAVLPPQTWEYSILALHVLIVVLLFMYAWPNFQSMNWRRFLLFLGLAAAGLISNNLLVPRHPRPYLLAIPNVAAESPAPFAPLLADFPMVLAGALLGPGPAFLIGLVQGIGRTFMTVSVILDPFYVAFFGFVVGILLQQDFGGRFFGALRQPIVAVPAAVLVLLPLNVVPVFTHVASSGLTGLEYAVSVVWANAGPFLLNALLAGVFLQLTYLVAPSLQAVQMPQIGSPFNRTLRRQLFWLFSPLIVLFSAALIYVVGTNAIRVAKVRVMEEMARDANGVAADVHYFIQTGQDLLAVYAADEGFKESGLADLQEVLQIDLRTVAFFDQLLLLDSDAQLVAAYPPLDTDGTVLTADEQLLLERVLDAGETQTSAVHPSSDDAPVIAFLAPADYGSDAEGVQHGALLGRTHIDVNPILRRILDRLRWTGERVDAFVVDETGRVIIHSHSTMFLAPWRMAERLTPLSELMGGKVYVTRNLHDNSRVLIYVLPVPGYSWTAVVELPYALVLEDAITTVLPMLLLQALLVAVLVAVIPVALNRITRPITGLAVAAQRVAAGEADGPLQVVADDELGQITAAVNVLYRDLADQRLVLETYLQSIAACASMTESPQSLSALLDRVARATGATVARLVVQPSIISRESVVLTNGTGDGLEIIDSFLASQLHDGETTSLLIPELSESELLDEDESLVPNLAALVALPVCLESHVVAVLWVGYVSTHDFDGVETDFLEAIASVLEPALGSLCLKYHLKVEQEILAAVLASTSDGVLITDADAILCLVNPALKSVLGIDPDMVLGSPISQSGLPQAILDLFVAVVHGLDPFEREIVLKDNRMIYAFVSPVPDGAGSESGRVVVLRDVSATLGAGGVRGSLVFAFSERLRTPLTLIRGYATMTPLVGALSDRQKQYLEKILVGVGQVGVLVDDLMKLSVVESSTGLKRESTALSDVLIEAVDQSEDAATEKGVTLRLEPAERMAVVDGDRSLLYQAVVNLIDNGVKYTPQGGSVAVSLRVVSDHAIICVSDTGIGIDRDELPHIFDRFYRSDRQEVSNIPGVGLGLTIVKSIVEWHGGKVWVESEMGQGSKVYIGLPLVEGPE